MARKDKPISGIYGICCVVTNKWYVGASKDIVERLKYHFRDMRADAELANHYDNWDFRYRGELGKDYWLHGESAFTCHVLAEVGDVKLFPRAEQFFILSLDAKTDGYNSQLSGTHRSW